MTLDSSQDRLTQSARCHACNARGSGRGNCKKCGTPFSKRHPPGTILGSYRLQEVIGEGGMGIVYLATHSRLGRRVAIKMLRSHYTDNPQAVHRFFAEARAVNKIHHPHIVEITDFIEQPGADNYYVMELLEGTNLAQVTGTSGIMPLPRSIAIMMQVASVVDAVHRAGIVHRDLKPDNVFLTERAGQQDFVKLVDFGVAKLVDDSDDFVSTHNTHPGAILGTPDYMSPEQASAAAVDHRTDIYAFGAMLYEIATGRLPLTGANFGELVVQLLTVTPTPPSKVPDLPHEIPKALDDLIMSCLAKQTIDRPDSMETVLEQLREVADAQDWIVYELNVMASGPHFARPASIPSGQIEPLLPAPPAPRASEPVIERPAPATAPIARRRMWPIAVASAVAVVLGVVVYVALSRGHAGEGVSAQVQAELALADQRIADGKLVASGGDDALAHLLAARKLDPANAAVRDRLHALAEKYQQLADAALKADSLAEAAAQLQVVLDAEPENAAAAAQMKDIESKMLDRQRGKQR
jgi:serine/threonine protein kinase